jgi:hypothetical protein
LLPDHKLGVEDSEQVVAFVEEYVSVTVPPDEESDSGLTVSVAVGFGTGAPSSVRAMLRRATRLAALAFTA